MKRRDRGLAYGIFSILLLGLGTFALMYILVEPAVTQLNSVGAGQLSGEAARGQAYAETAWTYLPFFAAAITAFALVARGVFEREGRV